MTRQKLIKSKFQNIVEISGFFLSNVMTASQICLNKCWPWPGRNEPVTPPVKLLASIITDRRYDW